MVEVDKSKLSPMMRQYLDIKEEHRDEILFFRLGDFYEMFFDDAITASRELELTLTGKQCGLEERAPMCGVPFHAADTYIARLIGKGYKVAICEQVEDPAAAKGIVRREVIQIVTPGTAMTGSMLNEKENNYIASVYTGRPSAGRAGQTGIIGLSYCDVSTGEICLTSFSGPSARQTLINELVKISASELILDEYTSEALDIEELRTSIDSYIDLIDGKYYRQEALRDTIRRQFDENGGILDGQHRLQACVLSGVPFQTIVMSGVPRDTFDTLDCGRARTTSQVLQMEGVKYNAVIASIIRGVSELRSAGHTAAHEKRLSNSAALAEYNKHASAYNRAAAVAATAVAESHAMAPKLAGSLFYYLVHFTKYFTTIVCTGECHCCTKGSWKSVAHTCAA